MFSCTILQRCPIFASWVILKETDDSFKVRNSTRCRCWVFWGGTSMAYLHHVGPSASADNLQRWRATAFGSAGTTGTSKPIWNLMPPVLTQLLVWNGDHNILLVCLRQESTSSHVAVVWVVSFIFTSCTLCSFCHWRSTYTSHKYGNFANANDVAIEAVLPSSSLGDIKTMNSLTWVWYKRIKILYIMHICEC